MAMEFKARHLIVAQYYRNIGVALPADYAQDVKHIEATYGQDFAVDTSGMRAAVKAAVTAGRPIHTDETVRDFAVLTLLNTVGISSMLADLQEQQYEATMAAHAVNLLELLQEPFEAAAATIDAAREQISPKVNLDSAALANVPLNLSAVWIQAHAGVTTIDLIAKIWQMIVTWHHMLAGNVTDDMRPLITADIEPEVYDELIYNFDDRPWDALLPIHRGLPLSLATPDEFDQRCEVIRADRVRKAQRIQRNTNTFRRIR